LEARERALLEEHGEEWLGALRPLLDDWVFHRGLLGIVVNVPNFLGHAAALCRSPWVHYIDVVDHAVGRANLETLAASPSLARVTILDLGGWYCHDPQESLIDDQQAGVLAAYPYVGGLECVNLRCNAIGDGGVAALAASPFLGRLERLDLRANRFGDGGVLALAASPRLPRLVLHLHSGLPIGGGSSGR
jgi:hypothetical protein